MPLDSIHLNPLLDELAAGECVAVSLEEFRAAGWRAAALVVRADGRDLRRVLVAVDASGSLMRYSDVRFSADGWFIEAWLHSGIGMVSLSGPRVSARGSAQDILAAAQLGTPREVAALVITRCAAELRAA